MCAGPWLSEFTDLRDKINAFKLDIPTIRAVVAELDVRIPGTGRNYPVPKLSERAIARMERDAAVAGDANSESRHTMAASGHRGSCHDAQRRRLFFSFFHWGPCWPPSMQAATPVLRHL